MGSQAIAGIVTVLTAIIGVAILTQLVSSKSNTSGVINAAGTAFGTDLSVAMGNSFTGGGINVNNLVGHQ